MPYRGAMELFDISHVELNADAIAKKIHAKEPTVARLVQTAQSAMDIKAGFRVSFVDERRGDTVVLDGVPFTSRVLCRNLSGVQRAFPFILTLGPEVDELITGAEDILEKYLLDEIGNFALKKSLRLLERHLCGRFALEKASYMGPGSLEDWSLDEQRALFALLDDVGSTLGVRLMESLLMIPRKTLSGIFFPSEATFLSCSLCPRERCDNRMAPYDEVKVREYGIFQESPF